MTLIVDTPETSFDFLGFSIAMSRHIRTRKPHLRPRPLSENPMQIKANLERLTGQERHRTALAKIVVGNVNRGLGRRTSYLHRPDSSKTMIKVNARPQQRVRAHLIERRKVKNHI